MSETGETPPAFDGYGNIADKSQKSKDGLEDRLKSRIDTVKSWLKWASHNISAGNWRTSVKPGEVEQKLEDLNQRLKNTQEVVVDKNGNIVPIKESPK